MQRLVIGVAADFTGGCQCSPPYAASVAQARIRPSHPALRRAARIRFGCLRLSASPANAIPRAPASPARNRDHGGSLSGPPSPRRNGENGRSEHARFEKAHEFVLPPIGHRSPRAIKGRYCPTSPSSSKQEARDDVPIMDSSLPALLRAARLRS